LFDIDTIKSKKYRIVLITPDSSPYSTDGSLSLISISNLILFFPSISKNCFNLSSISAISYLHIIVLGLLLTIAKSRILDILSLSLTESFWNLYKTLFNSLMLFLSTFVSLINSKLLIEDSKSLEISPIKFSVFLEDSSTNCFWNANSLAIFTSGFSIVLYIINNIYA